MRPAAVMKMVRACFRFQIPNVDVSNPSIEHDVGATEVFHQTAEAILQNWMAMFEWKHRMLLMPSVSLPSKRKDRK
jgi:hypothetical protein